MFEASRCVLRAYASSSTSSLAVKLTDFFLAGFYYFLHFHPFYSRCVSTIELSCCDSINYTFFPFQRVKERKKSQEHIKYYLHTFPTFWSSINATLAHSHTHTPHSFDSENEEKSIPFDGAYECCVLCFQPRQWKIHLYSLSTAVLCTQKEKKWKENHLNSETRKEIMIKKVYIQRGSFLNRLHSHNQKQCVHKSNQNEMNKKKHTFIKSKVDFSVRLKA